MVTSAVGTVRSPVAVILLSLVTLGIYSLYWQFATFRDMKEHAGEGIGGGLGSAVRHPAGHRQHLSDAG